MNKISQLEVDINNTLELYFYVKNLVSNNQMIQWIEMYEEDLFKQSISFGQPLGIFLLLEFSNIQISPSEILELSTNFIQRVAEFNNYLSENPSKFKDYDNFELFEYIDLLNINPMDLSLLERSFYIYINFCFKYKKNDIQIGVFKRWILS